MREDEIEAVFGRPSFPALARKILNRGLVCVNCQNPVHVYALNRVGGFTLAGHALTQSAEDSLVGMGYSHYPPTNPRNTGLKTVTECSLYHPEDPRFEKMAKKKKDPKVIEAVRAALFTRESQTLNRPVLWALHRAAAQTYPSQEERQGYLNMAETLFHIGEVLISHPYILPYAVARAVPFFVRQGKKGPYKVRYEEHGRQELLYTDIKGKERIAKVPEYLTLMIKIGASWEPMKWDTRQFPLTETASHHLAKREIDYFGQNAPPAPPRRTILVSIPTRTPLDSRRSAQGQIPISCAGGSPSCASHHSLQGPA